LVRWKRLPPSAFPTNVEKAKLVNRVTSLSPDDPVDFKLLTKDVDDKQPRIRSSRGNFKTKPALTPSRNPSKKNQSLKSIPPSTYVQTSRNSASKKQIAASARIHMRTVTYYVEPN